MDIKHLLKTTVERKASDLHISVGIPPMLRIDGDLVYYEDQPVTAEIIQTMLDVVLTEEQKINLQKELEIDLAYPLEDICRFRVNVYNQQRGLAAAFRIIPSKIPSFADLGLAPIFQSLCDYSNGIVLVTGPTGSGKSTTLAAMVNYINETRQEHIITVEDPVEFTHPCKKCLVNQRELNKDTQSFNMALRSALREDPDVILVGEMRDIETIRLALTAAETGHLVFGTLHTNSAAKTIDRIIDAFPAGEKEMIRAMLSESLRAVVAQTLLKRKGGGRVAAQEIMISTPAIRNLIRENKIPQIYTAIQTGQSHGMRTMEQHLQELAQKNLIDPIPAPPG